MDKKPYRVLVVDDSAFMRKIVSDLLAEDPELEVIGTARDGLDGVEKARTLRPDVMTLDVEMPRLDGFGTLQKLAVEAPVPVVMVSSLTKQGAAATFRCLSLGAVDFVAKPSGTISLDMATVQAELIAKVKAAARARPRYRRSPLRETLQRAEAPPPTPSRPAIVSGRAAERIVIIGSSTGGPGALQEVIPLLPGDLGAAVLVVQHMPPGFTASLADRLDRHAALSVREATEGDLVAPDQVLIAPGGLHMLISDQRRIVLSEDPPVHGVRPAVDRTLQSAVPIWQQRAVGVILTGMGHDGARGMLALKQAGGYGIAQDEETAVVYGMPRVAREVGGVDEVLPLPQIAAAIVRAIQQRVRA